jgi:hypothetical protein
VTHGFRSRRPAADDRRARLGVASLLEDRTVPGMGDEVMMMPSAATSVAAAVAATDQPVATAGTNTRSSVGAAPPLASQAAAAVTPTTVEAPSRLPATDTMADELEPVPAADAPLGVVMADTRPAAAVPMTDDLSMLG